MTRESANGERVNGDGEEQGMEKGNEQGMGAINKSVMERKRERERSGT